MFPHAYKLHLGGSHDTPAIHPSPWSHVRLSSQEVWISSCPYCGGCSHLPDMPVLPIWTVLQGSSLLLHLKEPESSLPDPGTVQYHPATMVVLLPPHADAPARWEDCPDQRLHSHSHLRKAIPDQSQYTGQRGGSPKEGSWRRRHHFFRHVRSAARTKLLFPDSQRSRSYPAYRCQFQVPAHWWIPAPPVLHVSSFVQSLFSQVAYNHSGIRQSTPPAVSLLFRMRQEILRHSSYLWLLLKWLPHSFWNVRMQWSVCLLPQDSGLILPLLPMPRFVHILYHSFLWSPAAGQSDRFYPVPEHRSGRSAKTVHHRSSLQALSDWQSSQSYRETAVLSGNMYRFGEVSGKYSTNALQMLRGKNVIHQWQYI